MSLYGWLSGWYGSGGTGAAWYSASGTPSDSAGANGDYYFRTSTGDVYKKLANTWGTPIANLKGPTGSTGSTGAAGSNGTNGTNGATWTSGSGVPSDGSGANGDHYFRTSNGAVYLKSGGTWGAAIANLTGPTGSTGSTGATGAAGSNGTNGTNGSTWTSGSGVPSDGSGANGDFYFRTTGDVYKKSAGTWGSPILTMLSGTNQEIFDSLTVHGANVASATTVNLDTATGSYVHITGTTTITGITLTDGRVRYIVFDGVLTFTHGQSLILPAGGSNITTAAGDRAVLRGEAAGVVRCVSYQRADGTALVAPTNISGNAAGLTPSTSNSVNVGTIELGHASDTTIARSSAGVISIEGVTVDTISGGNTLTNKRITGRVGSTTSSATPTINTDNVDVYKLTAQAADITSMTTNLSGTPVDGDQLEIRITGTAARAITWGTSFVAGPVALPTTTVTTKTLRVFFEFDSVVTHWVLLYSGSDS
jgi:hypothetical protein